jgi:hypothetical protein
MDVLTPAATLPVSQPQTQMSKAQVDRMKEQIHLLKERVYQLGNLLHKHGIDIPKKPQPSSLTETD